MTQNTLTQKARLFAQRHDLPYATALRAVDEPYRELRDLIYSVRSKSDALQEHFRLIGDRGRFSAAYPTPDLPEYSLYGARSGTFDYLKGLISSQQLPCLSESEFFIELGRRTERIERSKADDIWGYRELHRAGLVDKNELQLEPIFHYYYGSLRSGFEPMTFSGSRLGIFGANMSAYTDLAETYYLVPVTVSQLDALRTGESLSSSVELSPSYAPHSAYEEANELHWKQSYIAAYSYDGEGHDGGGRGPGLVLLQKSSVADLKAKLLSMDLDPSDLRLYRDLPLGVELEHALNRDILTIRAPGSPRVWLTTPGLLIIE